MARKTPAGGSKTPAKSADKAAPAAAPAATAQPASAPPGLEAGSKGQDAPTVLIVGGLPAAHYIEALKAGGIDVLPLAELDDSLLRQLGQFLVIGEYDLLPPDELVLQIEQAVGIKPLPYPPDVSGGDDPLSAALSELPGGTATTAIAGSEAPAVPQAGGNATDAVDDLTAYLDGDIEGLWIVAIPEQGFRRCGHRFTREGFAIALSALTEAQIEQLENEPNLKVERGIFGGRVEVQ